ncbi:DUF262 domain-containing protein [Tenacibaculum finnmarkense]|nr:DUF262 domain-containing protein [Tenacibaculum finnmarkense]
MNPEFQRKYKWDKDGNERASKFIESCLMRIPLPACYFAEKPDNTQEVIDGVQRITTIKNFFNDDFALEGLTIFKELEGLKFSQLGDYRAELETTTIRCVVLRKDNKKELINEIFARLNRGAVELTPQEIRHAVYPGAIDNLLIELSQNPIIEEFGKGERGTKTNDGRESEEIILRFFALNNNLDGYDNKLAKYMDKYMAESVSIEDTDVPLLKEKFDSTLQKCINTFDDYLFANPTRTQPRQSLAIYDLVMWSFSNENDDFITNNKQAIKDAFYQLCETTEFNKTMAGGVQQKHSILTRRRLWAEKLNLIKETNE